MKPYPEFTCTTVPPMNQQSMRAITFTYHAHFKTKVARQPATTPAVLHIRVTLLRRVILRRETYTESDGSQTWLMDFNCSVPRRTE